MYLLDTDVFSELRKIPLGKADARVVDWASRTAEHVMWLSVITVHEVTRGILQKTRRDPQQAKHLTVWLDANLALFTNRILSIDIAVAQQCATSHVPDPKPERDAFVAATALIHHLTEVTRNTRDFQGTGVPLLNPWNPL